jgi:uncharacterized protein YegL
MAGSAIDAINYELPKLRLEMLREPELAEVCWLALVTFSETAVVRMRLKGVSQIAFKPLGTNGVSTNYSEPFRLLRRTIAEDLYDLYRQGRNPYRPVVFFLSDGQHNGPGDWREPLGALTDRNTFHGAPNVIAFGFGDAREAAIEQVGLKAAFMPEEGPPSVNLEAFMTFLLSSLTASMTQSARDQDDVLVIPTRAPVGWRALRVPR